MSRLLHGLALMAAIWVFAAPLDARSQTRVLVVPGNAEAEVGDVAPLISSAGYQPAELGDDVASLVEIAKQERNREQVSLTALSVGLESARAMYLEQDFDKMIRELGELRDGTLALTSRSENRTLLWELSFQLGLAHGARKKGGDATAVDREFAFANAIDAERRPPADIYGPDVGQAYASSVAKVSGRAARPFRVDATPLDAKVLIDGVALIGNVGGRARPLPPGLHVVRVSAAGHRTVAKIVDTSEQATLGIELEPLEGTATEILGAAWAAGELRPGTETSNRLLTALASEHDASVVIWVGSGSPVDVIVVDPSGRTATESAATVAAATAALLERLDPSGNVTTSDSSLRGGTPPGSNNRKWLIAGGVGLAVVAIVVTGIVLASGDGGGPNGGGDRFEIGIAP